MRAYINKAVGLAKSQSARDTYVLFGGNIVSAFLGFLFTLIIARGLSVGDFGVFSAVNNLVTIISSVADIGISAGLVSFVASFTAKGDKENAWRYLKASLVARLVVVSLLSLALLAFAPIVAKRLLASSDINMVYWSVVLSFGLMFWGYFPSALQAYKRFVASISVDISLGIIRVLAVGSFFFAGALTLSTSFISFTLGTIMAVVSGLIFLGVSFLIIDTPGEVYSKLLRFSGWVGVNRIVSAISGRIDLQMLAVFMGAEVVGQYSIAQRLALFVTVLISSFSVVLATRLAAFDDREKEKGYVIKSTLATLLIVIGVIVWIIIARPFISLLFGVKYLPAVPIFQAFAASMVPFILATTPVTAIIYSMKKPIYIGYFSFFQLAAIFLLNLLLIPKIGPYGPLVAFFVVGLVLAIFSWTIVYNYYWSKK
ncbi:hypothetical protein A3E15_03205 [Candidatus Woesebacteria bacterium RIFCSPHIGHO2_12_FULL_42_9]|uniref:Polysaccharide biosynthesis protein C-terminal domain-containing protein n=2 Tax=Candidatus Woeseibacteriota TaxID=1752722 RepID=A0A1F8AUX2_9BACT|nr:MAG: hypothetical protein A3E15_03205 [Candidatus Woesebacteria bacterium RIFCSPHIGHO2_12_FULL_42_9]